jgi:hypothetical protein
MLVKVGSVMGSQVSFVVESLRLPPDAMRTKLPSLPRLQGPALVPSETSLDQVADMWEMRFLGWSQTSVSLLSTSGPNRHQIGSMKELVLVAK